MDGQVDRIFKRPMKSHLDLVMHRADPFKAVEFTLITQTRQWVFGFIPPVFQWHMKPLFLSKVNTELAKISLEDAMSVPKVWKQCRKKSCIIILC